MQHFVPAHDALLYGEKVSERLVPYRVGLPCLHWEAAIIEAGSEEVLLRAVAASAPQEVARSEAA